MRYAADPTDIDGQESDWCDMCEEYEFGEYLALESYEDDPAGEDGERRSFDLAPRAPCPSPSPVRLSEAERRLRRTFGDISRSAEHEARDVRCIEATWGEGGHAVIGSTKEDRSLEDATRWLRENDPVRTKDGLAAALDKALGRVGLSAQDVAAAFRPGRPSATKLELRERLRAIAVDLCEQGANRELLAGVLGCSRKALYQLIGTQP